MQDCVHCMLLLVWEDFDCFGVEMTQKQTTVVASWILPFVCAMLRYSVLFSPHFRGSHSPVRLVHFAIFNFRQETVEFRCILCLSCLTAVSGHCFAVSPLHFDPKPGLHCVHRCNAVRLICLPIFRLVVAVLGDKLGNVVHAAALSGGARERGGDSRTVGKESAVRQRAVGTEDDPSHGRRPGRPPRHRTPSANPRNPAFSAPSFSRVFCVSVSLSLCLSLASALCVRVCQCCAAEGDVGGGCRRELGGQRRLDGAHVRGVGRKPDVCLCSAGCRCRHQRHQQGTLLWLLCAVRVVSRHSASHACCVVQIGYNALMYAASEGNEDALSLLLAAGSDTVCLRRCHYFLNAACVTVHSYLHLCTFEPASLPLRLSGDLYPCVPLLPCVRHLSQPQHLLFPRLSLTGRRRPSLRRRLGAEKRTLQLRPHDNGRLPRR